MGSTSAAARGLQSWGLLACGAAGVAGLAVGAVVIGRTERAQRVSRWLMDGAQPARRFLPSLPSLPNLSLMRGAGIKGCGDAGMEDVAPEPTAAKGDLQLLLSPDADPDSDYEFDVATPKSEAAEEAAEEAAGAEWAQLVKAAPEPGERSASPVTPHTPGREGESLLPGEYAHAQLSQGSEGEEDEAVVLQVASGEPALASLAETLPEGRAAELDSSFEAAEAGMAVDEALLPPVAEELAGELEEPAQLAASPAHASEPDVRPTVLESAFDAAAQADEQREAALPEAAAAAPAVAAPEDAPSELAPADTAMELEPTPSEVAASEVDLSAADGTSGKKKKNKKKGRGPLRGPMHKLAKEVRRALIAMPN